MRWLEAGRGCQRPSNIRPGTPASAGSQGIGWKVLSRAAAGTIEPMAAGVDSDRQRMQQFARASAAMDERFGFRGNAGTPVRNC